MTEIGDRTRGVPARIAAVSSALPNSVLTNYELADIFPEWSPGKILEKTGIAERRIAASDETALDLGTRAANRLFIDNDLSPESIDFIIFCSQAPDYILPTSACILQERLNIPKSVGALDINLGCSGYVYGLSLAAALIAGGMAKSVLLVTADTYSKFINPMDRSVRTLFGDGACASLIASTNQSGAIGPFVFGTDGAGAQNLIVPTGGARASRSPETAVVLQDDSGNWRSSDNLYMNGAAVMSFTLREVPQAYVRLKAAARLDDDDIDYVVMHQANRFMLDALRKKMKLDPEKVPYFFESIGNTVSSSIPFVLEDLLGRGRLVRGQRVALLGFGVGLSWAGCIIEF